MRRPARGDENVGARDGKLPPGTMSLESSGHTKLILLFLRVMLTVSTTTSGASAVHVCEQLDSFIFIPE
jgi:hypothetical protein